MPIWPVRQETANIIPTSFPNSSQVSITTRALIPGLFWGVFLASFPGHASSSYVAWDETRLTGLPFSFVKDCQMANQVRVVKYVGSGLG